MEYLNRELVEKRRVVNDTICEIVKANEGMISSQSGDLTRSLCAAVSVIKGVEIGPNSIRNSLNELQALGRIAYGTAVDMADSALTRVTRIELLQPEAS